MISDVRYRNEKVLLTFPIRFARPAAHKLRHLGGLLHLTIAIYRLLLKKAHKVPIQARINGLSIFAGSRHQAPHVRTFCSPGLPSRTIRRRYPRNLPRFWLQEDDNRNGGSRSTSSPESRHLFAIVRFLTLYMLTY